jgi:glutathione S-transferase
MNKSSTIYSDAELLTRHTFLLPIMTNTTTLQLPAHFGIASLSILGVGITMLALGGKVGGARKRCGVELPLMYAVESSAVDEKQKKLYQEFNGWQRGHQNAVEGVAYQLVFGLLGALKHPLIVTAGNLAWCVGRLMYQTGYAKQGPKGRGTGAAVFHIGELLALGAAVSFALGHLDLDKFSA